MRVAGLYSNYQEYINSDMWKDKALNMVNLVGHCEICKQRYYEDEEGNLIKIPLVVHHRTYEHIGNEPRKDLLVLCRGCHYLIHEYANEIIKKNIRK